MIDKLLCRERKDGGINGGTLRRDISWVDRGVSGPDQLNVSDVFAE